MRTIIVTLVLAALCVPTAFAAEPSPNSASGQCKALLKSAPALFGAGKQYRTLGACVAAHETQAEANTASAAKTCQAERQSSKTDETAYRAANSGKSFAEKYGTNDNDRNAYGKCVSQLASEKTAEQQSAELRAAKTCKTELRMDAEAFKAANGGKTFAQKYGTNGNAKNAFGKCVSTNAKAAA